MIMNKDRKTYVVSLENDTYDTYIMALINN